MSDEKTGQGSNDKTGEEIPNDELESAVGGQQPGKPGSGLKISTNGSPSASTPIYPSRKKR